MWLGLREENFEILIPRSYHPSDEDLSPGDPGKARPGHPHCGGADEKQIPLRGMTERKARATTKAGAKQIP